MINVVVSGINIFNIFQLLNCSYLTPKVFPLLFFQSLAPILLAEGVSEQLCGSWLLTDVKLGQFIQFIEFHTKGGKGISGLDDVKTPAGRNTDIIFSP